MSAFAAQRRLCLSTSLSCEVRRATFPEAPAGRGQVFIACDLPQFENDRSKRSAVEQKKRGCILRVAELTR
jgi:hypothetical protein